MREPAKMDATTVEMETMVEPVDHKICKASTASDHCGVSREDQGSSGGSRTMAENKEPAEQETPGDCRVGDL